jgi:biopolymer transport protein ExbB/TolQ
MGTVWGMFTVFFQGSAEQEVILRGMGIALITTLLGLVVTIMVMKRRPTRALRIR